MIDINSFASRHIGPRNEDISKMLKVIKCEDLDELIKKTVPDHILFKEKLKLKPGMSEEFNKFNMQLLSLKNKFKKTYIGLGYHNTVTPSVILRNILENPGWYTAYTPYQPEVSQGRLEMLMNFQQMIIDLTGMDIANASLLDESTAAAEAMMMAYKIKKNKQHTFCIQNACHPQTISVLKTRANPIGIKIIEGEPDQNTFGCLIQNPDTYGEIEDLNKLILKNKSLDVVSIVAADIMNMVIMKSPGSFNADIVIGSSQRFGVPMGLGGPHAAFFATKDEYKRLMPGRLIGVSVDRNNRRSYRMALQTREQHIRREKATSNICTAQALLAIISAAYAIYHGPERLKNIAITINYNTRYLKKALEILGYKINSVNFFDTLVIEDDKAENWFCKSVKEGINFRLINKNKISLTIDETTTLEDIDNLISFFNHNSQKIKVEDIENQLDSIFDGNEIIRNDNILIHPIFNIYHSETEMMRYLKKLENKDITLNRSMIPLGSCTMKLNAASEMIPISLPGFANAHPFLEKHQREGYNQMMHELISMLKDITGFDAISLQPNAGAQGEFAGLLAIKKFHESNNQGHRKICLIPNSAHGTNPASAQMCGMEVSIVKCDHLGNVDLIHLDKKIAESGNELAALMITYPSTHGVFEENISEICQKIHDSGGQVYMDGANLNAMVGIAKPGKFGPDVSHMNLHKTFCIPHGGGGPGMGPIGVKSHLENFLPGHPIVKNELGLTDLDAVSAAPWGSPSILPISYSYISMMGDVGLKFATQVAILNANYVKEKLSKFYTLLYAGKNGMVAHECIIDIRPIKDELNISEEDIAKRLIDYGFHAPTMSFPVPGTLMIEPTESESKEELDRFCTAMISIYEEIEKVRNGKYDSDDNPIKNAPHTIEEVSGDNWDHKYTRTEAAFPHSYLYNNKYWAPVARIDNVYGDRNLFCVCPPIEEYEDVSNA
ncbi:MAG: aminomethyl-transferring glycine dehydrogenase [Pelagibacteraceae bacterium]|nr:aminomethyl-transferring glycine dehydrogenase [Pelagibacteraceae bacterium]